MPRVEDGWSEGFKADVARFFGIRNDAVIVSVDPEVQVYDPDEPCDTCKMSWFAVEVSFRLPNGVVVEETHAGDMGEFMRAVSSYSTG